MRANSESLVLATMTYPMKSPAAPFEEPPFEENKQSGLDGHWCSYTNRRSRARGSPESFPGSPDASSGQLLQANFESLVFATMTAPTKSPVSPLMEIAPTARDQFVSLSSNAIGAYLTVARFWIPPGTDAGGLWSHPVWPVIGVVF
jgi:hypothetical protein